MTANTYLHFNNGRCEEALDFYVKALGAKLLQKIRYSDMPAANSEGKEWNSKIMHGRIAVGDSIIMATDGVHGKVGDPAGFLIDLEVDTPAEAEKLFGALSENAKVSMPMGETPWAHRFGMLHDQFGVPWIVTCEKAMK